jgi:hypothetical protein
MSLDKNFPDGVVLDWIGDVDLFPATLRFQGLDRDAAVESFSTIAPSPLLADVLKLGRNEQNIWRDASGTTAYDPARGSGDGPPAFLVRADVVARIDPGYELCWVLAGENRVVGGMGRYSMPDRIDVAGFWRLSPAKTPIGQQRHDWVSSARPPQNLRRRKTAKRKR